ncbi:MAG: hypothetical protein K5854_03055, partial [Prevotella sp.]|nr:hypothetical protein [Prevotella sp.]
MQKITNLLVAFLAVLFISCSDDEKKYSPEFASVFSSDVLLSVTDEAGNDLLADKDMENNVSIYGGLSKRNIGFDMKSLSLDAQKIESTDGIDIVPQNFHIGKPFNYISFGADLPNSADMEFHDFGDNIFGYGTSTMIVSVKGRRIKLLCHYKENIRLSNGEIFYGNCSLNLREIEIDGKYYNAKYYPGDLVLCLTLSGNTLKVDTK